MPHLMAPTYALFGNPINHTKSPVIHHLFAEQTNQNLNYLPILVPVNKFPEVLTEFSGQGANVTSPFKEQAYQMVTFLTPRAAKAKAVNTIKFNPDGTTLGDNTDGIGFVRDITRNIKITLKNKSILILGSGGAARGILAALIEKKPKKIIISSRNLKKANLLASEFAKECDIAAAITSDLTSTFDLIINAAGKITEDNFSHLISPNTYCYDIDYAHSSFFLRIAREKQAYNTNGLGMLIEQAAESFLFWHGIKPQTQPILKSLLNSP